jgi:hypothetical protein
MVIALWLFLVARLSPLLLRLLVVKRHVQCEVYSFYLT